MLELDGQTVEALDGIAELAGVTRSEVISVMLSTKVYNDKRYQEDRLKSKKKKIRPIFGNDEHTSIIGLGDK